MTTTWIPTQAVCQTLGLTEPALRHALRRVGAPRPAIHPTAHIFLWTEDDICAMAKFLGMASPLQDKRDEGTS